MTQYSRFPPESSGSSPIGPIDVISTPAGFSTISPGYPTQIAVGTTSTQLFPANPLALYRHVVNNSSQMIFIQYGASAALNQGIPLIPRGVLFITSIDLFKGVINAIGLINNQLIDVTEGI